MNWLHLRAEIQHQHYSTPQVAMVCELALREMETALATLARHGHHFELVAGHQAVEPWPRPVFHFKKGRRLVQSQRELDDLGPGWYASPLDAELEEGEDRQFAEKGGVRRAQLPADVPEQGPVGPHQTPSWAQALKSKFRQMNGSSVQDGEAQDGNG